MFLKRRITEVNGSPGSIAWRRFLNDKLGLVSVITIAAAVLIACLGYLITPDSTPYANNQHLELGLKKPGFSVLMLPLKRASGGTHSSLLRTMFIGKANEMEEVPVRSWRQGKNGIFFVEFGAPAGDASQVKFIPAGGAGIPSSRTFLLGTDRFGRDYLSQLLIGTRVSLSVGLISVAISLLLGITLGALAGYFRGAVDNFIVWLINVVWSIPTLLLVIAITFALGKGFWQVFIAVGLTMWVEVARVVRGQILGIREKEYVEAARALGFSDFRIIFRHILPNVMAAVIVISAANFASAILMEAGLSFLGLGVQPPVPSWGSMIKENYGYIVLDHAYLAVLPGLAIMVMVLAFMLMGNALRDALDVRMS
ncbi:MAG TPA: ABC transporter permease [Bacteroidales bacterium]|nr:ABC transporter permease [Bacteroidales bacterium]HPS63261.1 ABC transporter permease [Bacteroidales bacterium]